MKNLSEEQYNQVIDWIKKILKDQVYNMEEYGLPYETKGIGEEDIEKLQELCPYDQYLESISVKKKAKKEYTQYENEAFEEWWTEYPVTVKFEYKGVKFTGTRVLREQKEKCKKLYVGLFERYAPDTLVNSLKVEVAERKIESYRIVKLRGRNETVTSEWNQMNYMKASVAYLNSERYIAYMEAEMPQDIVQEKKVYQNSTDM